MMNTKAAFDDFDLDVQKIHDVAFPQEVEIAPLSGGSSCGWSYSECNTCDMSGSMGGTGTGTSRFPVTHSLGNRTC